MAVKTLPFYTEYFNVSYPLSKIDLIAIPDFLSSLSCLYVCFIDDVLLHNVVAMENWGLITFEERLLLVDPDNTTQSRRQYTANLVGKPTTSVVKASPHRQVMSLLTSGSEI